ncbi:hypothetical protein PO902_15425 [Planococcus maritimus]|nr:hypothetical protein [Planococcus sp. SK3692]MDE4086439.1 hypothetical protein [Planococcus maritimus]
MAISPSAIQLLKEALCNVYWYKRDLRSFLLNCISNRSVINNANWKNDYKRQIVSDIVDELMMEQDKNLGDIRRLLSEVSKMSSFRHLEQLEDGQKKAVKAKNAVHDLREIIKTHDEGLKKEKEIKDLKLSNQEKIKKRKALYVRLDEINSRYTNLVVSKNFQSRGFELEKVLYDIFDLFDLDPKASFRNIGEQIDGAFSLEGTDYLFEAKWQSSYMVNASDLDSFSGKISRKLDNTLGLFLSINGFSDEAIKIYSSGRSSIILMDGIDLLAVLEGKIDMISLIVRKRRHAAQTGNVYFPVSKILDL